MYESSSFFGQIVFGLCPHNFTWVDIDGALWRKCIRLLRIIEHKSPGQHNDPNDQQRDLLKLLARIIEHIKACPDAKKRFDLHEGSGVYLIVGDPHEGNQLGPSKITRIHDGRVQDFPDEFTTLCWLPEFNDKLRDKKSWDWIAERISKRRKQP